MSEKIQRWLRRHPLGAVLLAWFVLLTVSTALLLDVITRASR